MKRTSKLTTKSSLFAIAVLLAIASPFGLRAEITPDKTDKTDKYAESREALVPDYANNFSPAVRAEQNRILDEVLSHGKSAAQPRIVYSSGGTGSGKSRVLRMLQEQGLIPKSDFLVIDPDAIKELMPLYHHGLKAGDGGAADSVHEESAYLSRVAFIEALKMRKNIILDTTLAKTDFFIRLMQKVRKEFPEYAQTILMVETHATIAQLRTMQRAQETGRHVADQVDSVITVENNVHPVLKSIQLGSEIQYFLQQGTRVPIPSGPVREALSIRGPPPDPYLKHVVFDLDWTLLYDVTGTPASHSPKAISASGHTYRVSDHTTEVIEDLIKDPNVRVSFFSAASDVRNVSVLKQIKLRDGRSLYDVAYRVLSSPQMVDTVPEEARKSLKYSERFKKDLSRISPHIENVIIFEDIPTFTMPNQRRNVLFLGKTYRDYDTYAEAEAFRKANPSDLFTPPDQAEYHRERNKIVRGYNIVKEALAEGDASGVPFSERVARRLSEPVEDHIARGLVRLKHSGCGRGAMREALESLLAK